MLKKVIIFAIALPLLSATAFAQGAREKVVLYNLEIRHEKSIFLEEREERAPAKEFDYYSYIIPAAIAKNLKATGMIDAEKINENLKLDNVGSDAFSDRMRGISAANAARFIIGGRCTIKGRKMTIELAFFDADSGDFSAITRESFETGAELKNIINDLTGEIEQKLRIPKKEKMRIDETEETAEGKREAIEEKKEPERRIELPEKPAISPFLKAYRALEGLSFGVNTGRIFIKGPFSRVYEDSDYVAPYISYDILRWLGVSAEADYLSAQNGSIIIKNRSSLLLWGITINANFIYPLFKYFGVKLTAGFGASIGRIFLGSDNPISGLHVTKDSVDPYLNLSGSAFFTYKPLLLQFGCAYKAAFFKGKTLSLVTVFFGIGYRL